ncbi:Hypothetical predicted protein, partial [Pelobates cultripes]
MRAGSRLTVGSLKKVGDVLRNPRGPGRSEEVLSQLLDDPSDRKKEGKKNKTIIKVNKGKYVPRI